MIADAPKKSSPIPSQEVPAHSRALLLALSRVAKSIQQAHTAEDFYYAVGEEMKSLGGEVALLIINDDGRSLSMVYTSYATKTIHKAEKLMGLSSQGYRIPRSPNGIFEKIISGDKAVFLPSTRDAVAEALPDALRPFTDVLMKTLRLRQCILAPLRVEDKNLGLLTLSGLFLSEDDIPALESFAGQIAAGLQNVRLMQKLQDELGARKQAEERLQISTSTYEGIFNSITEAAYILDGNGVFLKVNSGAEKMYGYPPDYFVGRTPEFVSAPGRNDLARVSEFISQAYLGQTVEFEFWGLRKDGTVFPKDVRLTPGIYFGQKVVIAVGRDMTERSQAEDAIKQAEARYRLLADHTTDTIWLSDMNLRTTYVSPSAEKIRGYTQEQLHELPLDQNLTPASYQLAMEVFAAEIPKVYADPKYSPVLTLELEFLNRDGTIYYTESKLSIMRDENGNPVSILGESRDIAERKRIENALFESERYYRALIENATDGIIVVNADGTIRYQSPSVVRMLGYEPDTLIGTNAFDLIAPDDLARIVEAFMKGLETPGFTHRGEYRFRHFSGEWRHIEIVSRYLLEDPVIAGIIVNGRDITERKQAEESLIENEKQYRLLAERMADVIWVLDVQTMRFKYVSPSVEKLLGYTPEEILELSIDQVILPDSLEHINATLPERIRHFLEGDQTAITDMDEIHQWCKDGSNVLTEVVSTLVLNEKTELEAIGVARDITRRKQVENELRHANELLETAHRELQKMFAYEQLLARTDGLTGLYNRRYFFELAGREFKASMRYQRPLSIILLDVDGFKQVNDTFGHATGDAILLQIAETATAQIRNVDVLARYGGDEFIVLLPQTHAQEAFHIAERIRNSVAARRVVAENSPFIVTLSLGVAEILHSPRDGSVEDTIRRADKALYKVKQNGSNHTAIFTLDSGEDL